MSFLHSKNEDANSPQGKGANVVFIISIFLCLSSAILLVQTNNHKDVEIVEWKPNQVHPPYINSIKVYFKDKPYQTPSEIMAWMKEHKSLVDSFKRYN